MRILQVTPTFVPSKFGGVKVVSYSLSKALAQRGHEVIVYTTDAEVGHSRLRNVHDIRNMDGFRVRYFKNISNLLAFKYRLFLPVRMASAVRKEIGSFDIIHLHDFRSLQSVAAYYYAKKYNIPYVLQAHGSLPRILSKQKLKRIYDILWGYRLLKDASKVIAVTKAEAEQYKSMGVSEHKIEIVPNGLDLSEFDNLPDRGEFRAKYGLDANQKIILYLGRIHKIKGLDLLVKVFTDLSKFLDDAKLVIVGPDDGYLTSLKKLVADLKISNKVLFTGPLYGQEKLEAYVDADVYVLPSRYEAFSVGVLEAFACGTAVIVTDHCGIADVINNRAGLVVPWDKEHLSNAILQILSDDKLRRRLTHRGKSLVREKLNWQRVVEQVERVYLDCISSRC